ncbi:hypothetical protein JCM3774_002402 [Rhodotorula dairenensis]
MSSRTTPPKKGDQASYLPTSNSGSARRSDAAAAPSSSSLSSGPGNSQVAAQQNAYRPGSPIRFYDDEVQRMQREVDRQAPKDRRDARRELRSRPRRAKSGITVTGFFLRAAAVYVLIAYFLVCPEDPSGERAVCRALSKTGARVRQYEPLVKPYVAQVQHHLEPYWLETRKHLRPYYEVVEPYYQRVDQLARPRLADARRVYREKVLPFGAKSFKAAQNAVKPVTSRLAQQYERSLAPSVEWYSESLQRQYSPHVQHAKELYRQHVAPRANDAIRLASEAARRSQHHWTTHLVPFSQQVYSATRQTYTTQVHPRTVTLSRHATHFWRTRVMPTLLRFWSRFIAPQLDKIRERIFEYKSKKAKLDAMERVDKASVLLAEEQKADEVEDFIKDLRDEKVTDQAAEVVEEAPPVYSATHAPPPPSPEDAAKLRAEKRAALEARHTTYEQEIARLGQAEYSLLVDRLVELREQSQEDITARFEASLESLDDEGDLMVGRLGKYFARVGADLRDDEVEAKAREADELAAKAHARVARKAQAIRDEVAEYRTALKAKEVAAVAEAKAAVTNLVDKAQSELGQGWTWLDGVTAKDWQRYHGLRDAEKNLHSRFADLYAGAIKETRLSTPEPYALLEYFDEQPEKLVAAFEKILDKIKIRGQRELKGEWLGVVPEAQKAAEAATGQVGALVDDIKVSASSLAGYEAAPTNVVESASSMASVAQVSASSLAQAAASALPSVAAPEEYVSTVEAAVAEASQRVLRAVDIEPSPTDLKQAATSVANAASSSASRIVAAASQSVVRAVGKEPAPTDLPQSASSVARAASSSAASIASQVVSDYPSSLSSAVDSATQAGSAAVQSASSLASSVSSVVSSVAGTAATQVNTASVREAANSATERAGKILGDASQGALRAVGVEPSPTDVHQSATSVGKAAHSAVSSVASVVGSLAAPHSSFFDATPPVVASASSLISSASSIASSLVQPHPSYSQNRAAASASAATAAVKEAIRHVEL